MKSNTSTLGLRLKYYRKHHKLTQEKAAEYFGVSLVYYGEIERGKRFPGMDTLNIFCEKMHCSLSDLVGDHIPADIDLNKLERIQEIENLLYDSSDQALQATLELLKALRNNSDSKN